MTEEFNLSEKIKQGLIKEVLWAEDVKEFIRRLKEVRFKEGSFVALESFWKAIDKLAGKSLI